MPANMRDALCQSLPPSIKSALRSKIHSFVVGEELSVSEIKAEMEETLHWLVPIATDTIKAHHGFGWVGEWVNTGFEGNRKATGPIYMFRIETLHHADKDKTERYILEMLLWLQYLLSRSSKKYLYKDGSTRFPMKFRNGTTMLEGSGDNMIAHPPKR
ncbi:hypothetical protein SAY86_014215 [Trapa natans]|uniref:DUF668 domain-containing protein n=1 Tax=Trapa natans TaxID=22666 RepID=A0AAN7KSW5_TRANT|nr:hypothetical protein SAY86_014215 [Trapa natans]